MKHRIWQSIERSKRRRLTRPRAKPVPASIPVKPEPPAVNKLAIIVSDQGDIQAVVANQPIQVYGICDYAPDDRVYRYSLSKLSASARGLVEFTPGIVSVCDGLVENIIGDSPIGHDDDGRM